MKPTTHHVKIVLPCHNEGSWLRVTIDSLLEKTDYPSFEVFVLANGDSLTDFSFISEPAYRERVRIEHVPRPLGVGNCINEAVRPGDATFYAFLDAHCLVEQEDWLSRLVECIETHPRASMVQPEVVQFIYHEEPRPGEGLDDDLIEEAYCAYSITWGWPYRSPSDIAWVQTEPQRNTPYEAMAGGGMAVFTKAETFHRLGKYDSEVDGWYPETMDYCVHGWLLGYPMLVEPRSRVLHRQKTREDQRTNGTSTVHTVHGVLRTAYKYLSLRRRDLAEILFRGHGLEAEVDRALAWISSGGWLEERARFLRERVHDDDWLFSKFQIYEERFGLRA